MTTGPKNKRLSDSNRDTLKRFAKRQIEATQDRAALNDAYDGAADAVHAEVVKRWPQKDMVVLARYNAAAADPCVYIAGSSDWDYQQFTFREDDKRITIRPNRSGCSRTPIQLEGDAAKAYAEYARLTNEDGEQVRIRLRDFCALIDNTTNFNALADVWPAVEAMRSEIVGNSASLSVLSEEVVDRLRADPALAAA